MNNSKILPVIVVLFLLLSCSAKNKDTHTIILYGTDTLKSRGVLLIKPEKFDSALNAISKRDSIYLLFLHGFNNTEASLSADNSSTATLHLTTSPIVTLAAMRNISKLNKTITVEIKGEKHFLPVVRKYLMIKIDYDSISKKLEAEYSNDIPIFE